MVNIFHFVYAVIIILTAVDGSPKSNQWLAELPAADSS